MAASDKSTELGLFFSLKTGLFMLKTSPVSATSDEEDCHGDIDDPKEVRKVRLRRGSSMMDLGRATVKVKTTVASVPSSPGALSRRLVLTGMMECVCGE